MGFDNVNMNVSGPVQPSSTYKTKVIKGNHSFATQVTDPNTKYVIKHDFDLGGESVTIPANCIFEFDGGSLNNGALTGEVAIINQPEDFLLSIDCTSLNIRTMRHLSEGDIVDTIDGWQNNGLRIQRCEQNLKSLNAFYSVKRLDSIFAVSLGDGDRYRASIRLTFYDKNFFMISYSDWLFTHNGYTIPEGAVYVSAVLSFDCREIANIPTLLGNIYTNFLDNESVLLNSDFTRDRKGNTIEYYNVDLTDFTRVYIEGVSSSASYKKYYQFARSNDNYKSVCIPYSLLKQFDYICVKPNETHLTRIHFLRKEPVENGIFLTPRDGEEGYDYYSATYKNPVTIQKEREAVYYPIPSDVRYIIIYCQWNDSWATPEYVRLYTKEKLVLDTLSDVSPAISSSVRDVNKYSIHLMHWNIGNFSHGGYKTSIDDNNFAAKRDSFVAFINKYKDYHILLNEYNSVFANRESGGYSAVNIFPNYYTQKVFPRTNQWDNLAMFSVDSLVGYKMEQLTSYVTPIEGVDDNFVPKPYVIYRYFVANTSLYVIHTHLSSYMSSERKNLVYQQMINAAANYNNVIIVGDFNQYESSLTPFTEAGYSIANRLDLDGGNVRPTHVSWNHETETPVTPTVQNTLDWCVYKGGFTVSDFHVCLDAVDSGATDGDVSHMLSDHWPIAITLNFNSAPSVATADRGNYKFDPTDNLPKVFNGKEWLNLLQRNSAVTLTDFYTFVPGFYQVSTGTAMSALANSDKLPKTLKDNPAGFAMVVFPLNPSTNKVCALIIPNNTGVIYCAVSTNGTETTLPTSWDIIERFEGLYDKNPTYVSHKGTTSERPSASLLGNKPWYIGFVYIDTTINKPIWWTGNTTSPHTGWVDADGNDV